MVMVIMMVMVRRLWIVIKARYIRCFGLATIKNNILNIGNYNNLNLYILKLVFFLYHFF